MGYKVKKKKPMKKKKATKKKGKYGY